MTLLHDARPSHDGAASWFRSKRQLEPLSATSTLSFLPFLLTFILVAIFSWRTLFPLLSGQVLHSLDGSQSRNRSFRLSKAPSRLPAWAAAVTNHVSIVTFSTTMALSAVLAELIVCEISNTLDPSARGRALQFTVSALLVSLVVVIPMLEIQAITSAASWKSSDLKKGTKIAAWFADLIGLLLWLAVFWLVGRAALESHSFEEHKWQKHGLSEGSLERIGIIGITLMASLAGFAAVSSLWQTFGVRTRPVVETDISRKQTGLESTTELLQSKELRLRNLERKITDSPKSPSFFTRLAQTVRPEDSVREYQSLRVEVSGLEEMHKSLSSSLTTMRARHASQQQAGTPLGRLILIASYSFSIYCLYRILATSLTTFRRYWQPSSTFASTDPVTRILTVFAKHWDPSIDRAAWARQIAFFLSGLMLLASFNAVLQTVLLFGRFTPQAARRVLVSATQNLALFVAQISGTYVVSTALLLRSNLPREMGSVIEGALGAPLGTVFMERWFEGWFLGAAALTAVGIWLGRTVLGTSDWEADLGESDVELGKMN